MRPNTLVRATSASFTARYRDGPEISVSVTNCPTVCQHTFFIDPGFTGFTTLTGGCARCIASLLARRRADLSFCLQLQTPVLQFFPFLLQLI